MTQIKFKEGDFFKGIIDNYYVTGMIVRNEDENDETSSEYLIASFNNDSVNENIYFENSYFEHSACFDSFSQIEKITKKQHEKLEKIAPYRQFLEYDVKIVKNAIRANDLFIFGCGAIKVTRNQIESLLKVLSIKGIGDVFTLLEEIQNEGEYINSNDVPAIKQLLAHEVQ